MDQNISDLFFNTDVSDAKEYDRGDFSGFDDDKMLYEAELFLGCLDRLNVGDLPSARELVDNFYGRI